MDSVLSWFTLGVEAPLPYHSKQDKSMYITVVKLLFIADDIFVVTGGYVLMPVKQGVYLY